MFIIIIHQRPPISGLGFWSIFPIHFPIWIKKNLIISQDPNQPATRWIIIYKLWFEPKGTTLHSEVVNREATLSTLILHTKSCCRLVFSALPVWDFYAMYMRLFGLVLIEWLRLNYCYFVCMLILSLPVNQCYWYTACHIV